MKLTLGHLYGDLLNLYADRGNIITWQRRCAWRGIELEVRQIGIGERVHVGELDLLFMGGGQDGDQKLMADDFFTLKAADLRAALDDGLPMLVVCGGYQLFGHYYQPALGDRLPGLGLFDLHTVHPGAHVPRCIGNVVLEWKPPEGTQERSAGPARRTLVGFENHGGRTVLGMGARPLGHVIAGHGNNSEDGTEGAVVNNAYGTYMHGSLLPKNPHFADHLLHLALNRRHPGATLQPLDDSLEWQAHDTILHRYAKTR